MAALLLTTLSESRINFDSEPTILINDINSRVDNILQRQQKIGFSHHIKISHPTTTDNHIKIKKALVETLQELYALNIRSAMQSGDDWLGAFYEVFLKYASWAQDLGIVLTPRHITKFIAETMDILPNDIIYDPTCGTGGFLVAGFDQVKQNADKKQIDRFKQHSIFGIEQDDRIAALAVVNMIFRGDGKNNIKDGNCFANFLESVSLPGVSTAKYISKTPTVPPVTKVMMNPPFSLKRNDEKEYEFIEHALKQMENRGILFSILPYSSMVRPGVYLTWRRERLLKNNTLLAVITFPIDLFYPVGITTVGIFVKKGVPHPSNQNVFWVRALNDGFLKSKGKRLPNKNIPDELLQAKDILKAFIRNQGHPIPNIHQLQKASPINFSDSQLELVPEAYLDQENPTAKELSNDINNSLRESFAYLVRLDKAIIKPELLVTDSKDDILPYAWQVFTADQIFKLKRGHFHSISALDKGDFPTISRISSNNGLVGFYDIPEKAEILPPKTITVSTVTGDTFVQPVSFIATDNVVLCTPNKKFKHLSLADLYFIATMMNRVKWRYSYGRQCYMTKFAKTEILLPVTNLGEIDTEYMESQVINKKYWKLVESVINAELKKITL